MNGSCNKYVPNEFINVTKKSPCPPFLKKGKPITEFSPIMPDFTAKPCIVGTRFHFIL